LLQLVSRRRPSKAPSRVRNPTRSRSRFNTLTRSSSNMHRLHFPLILQRSHHLAMMSLGSAVPSSTNFASQEACRRSPLSWIVVRIALSLRVAHSLRMGPAMFRKPLWSPSSRPEASMQIVIHGTTVVSTCRTMTLLHGLPPAILGMAAVAAANTSSHNSRIQAMQPQDTQCGPRPTAVVRPLLILQTQDTQAQLAHRVLKCYYFPPFLESLCSTLAGYTLARNTQVPTLLYRRFF